MATIQVVLDDPLLKAANKEAKRQKVNRSSLIREALKAHLQKLHNRELEEQERRAYQAVPDDPNEFRWLLAEAVWPED